MRLRSQAESDASKEKIFSHAAMRACSSFPLYISYRLLYIEKFKGAKSVTQRFCDRRFSVKFFFDSLFFAAAGMLVGKYGHRDNTSSKITTVCSSPTLLTF